MMNIMETSLDFSESYEENKECESLKQNSNYVEKSCKKYNGEEYRGDAQVLSGFFEYHYGNATPPPASFELDEDMTYYYATINVEAISYIVKQRNWKLPQLSSTKFRISFQDSEQTSHLI